MNTLDQNTKFDAWDALRQDRDGWRQRAIDQAEYIQHLEQQLSTLQKQIQTLTEAEDVSEKLPQENDYQALVQWLAAEKALGNDYYTEANYNRSKMCRNLSDKLGWVVDQNSLRKAQNR